MRRALIVGIDHYEWSPLESCVNDAKNISQYLERHENGEPNFDCFMLTSDEIEISRTLLKQHLFELFQNDADVALLYFSGHGKETGFGSFLVTQDALKYDEGVSLDDILLMTYESRAREIIIILDCCFSGHFGNDRFKGQKTSVLREGVSVITSSRDHQVSLTDSEKSVFTEIICEALDGEAANLLGKVNVAGIYSYADKVLSSWQQRPVFKSHVSTMIPIRNCNPRIHLDILRRISDYFDHETDKIQLNPEFELFKEPEDELKEQQFSDLLLYGSAGLVTSEEEDYLHLAASKSKTCQLTHLGQFYWKMAKQKRF